MVVTHMKYPVRGTCSHVNGHCHPWNRLTCDEEKLSFGKTTPYSLIVCLIRSSRSGKEKDCPTAASSFPSTSAERELSTGLERTEVNTAEDRKYSQPTHYPSIPV